MPQMAPLLWGPLSIFVITSLLTIISIIYFSVKKKNKFFYSKYSFKNMNWKW